MGALGAIASSISILGSILYYKFSKKIDLKKLLYFVVFLGACTTLSYLYFTPVSAIIYSVVYSTIGMFIFLNIMTFMARSTISGKEATSFALLCAINNLAGTCSTLAGAWLYPLIGLKYLIIISAITSFACLPLIKHLKVGGINETL
jgi:predicted MFS family arabinose efflux permease